MATKKPVPLHSVREVVEAFGGTNTLARWAKIGPPAVSNWIAEGWIPPAWYLAISEHLREDGYEVDPKVFRQFEKAAS